MKMKKRLFAAMLSAVILCSGLPGVPAQAAQAEARAAEAERGKILELSFDGGEAGLESPGAKVTMNGKLSYSGEDGYSGQALRFDGNAANYLAVTDEKGGSLLKGQDNITIS